MSGLKNSDSTLRLRNLSGDEKNNNAEWLEGARFREYSSSAEVISISSTPLAKAKRVIASRSRWIQQKKRKPEKRGEEEADTSHIQKGIENIRMTSEHSFSPDNNSSPAPLTEVAILPPLPPPRSLTPITGGGPLNSLLNAPLPTSTSVRSKDATILSHTSNPGSWSASRAPPTKSCLLKSRVIPSVPSTSSPIEVMSKENICPISNETPVPTSRKASDVESTVRSNSSSATPKHVKFGTVDAAEFDLERPAVEFTPLSTEVTQAKYSIEKKYQESVQAEVEEEEINEETKQNTATLAEWDEAFDEWEDDINIDSKNNKRDSSSNRTRRNNRRSSTFFSKTSENLIAKGEEELEEYGDDGSQTKPASPNSSPSHLSEKSRVSNDEELLLFSDEVQTSPIESCTHDILRVLLPNNLNECSSPLLFHHRDSGMVSSNSSSDHALASLRSLHSSGALLSPNTSSLSDDSTEEILGIRVSLERNLDNAFNNNSINSENSQSNKSNKNDFVTLENEEDKTAIQSLMVDSKIEIHRDLDALLINFANRHEFHGSGTFFFESDLFDRKVMNFITREDESMKDMLSCFTNNAFGLISKMSFLEQVNIVVSKALQSECVARRSEHATGYFDSAAKLSEAIIQFVLYDFMEWEVFLLEQLFLQFQMTDQQYENVCSHYDRAFQENRQIEEEHVSSEVTRMACVKNVSKHVERLAKDIRVLESELKVAESQVNAHCLNNQKLSQNLTLHRKALSLIQQQEKCFINTDLLSFEPQVLSWNTVELLFPSKLCNSYGISACLRWTLSDVPSGDVSADSSYSSSILSTAYDQVLSAPLLSCSSEISGSTFCSSASFFLLKALFEVDHEHDTFCWSQNLLEMVGLLDERHSTDLSDAVLTASKIFSSIQMLDSDISELELEFQCKASVLLPSSGRIVGLKIQPHDCSFLLTFCYDPEDMRTIVRMLPKSVNIRDSSGLIHAADERCRSVDVALKEMQDISCNSLVLRHVCRRAVDLFHTC